MDGLQGHIPNFLGLHETYLEIYRSFPGSREADHPVPAATHLQPTPGSRSISLGIVRMPKVNDSMRRINSWALYIICPRSKRLVEMCPEQLEKGWLDLSGWGSITIHNLNEKGLLTTAYMLTGR